MGKKTGTKWFNVTYKPTTIAERGILKIDWLAICLRKMLKICTRIWRYLYPSEKDTLNLLRYEGDKYRRGAIRMLINIANKHASELTSKEKTSVAKCQFHANHR